MKYIISNKTKNTIVGFYLNVAKKYKHTYSKELMHKNIDNTVNSIYKIENGLLRRKPTISRWNGMHMATAGKWHFAYRIEGDAIYIEDACHAQNMHEARLRDKIRNIIMEAIQELMPQS